MINKSKHYYFLINDLEYADPIEDGMNHPGEKYLKELVEEYGLINVVKFFENKKYFCSILRLCSRLETLSDEDISQMVQLYMEQGNISVQDNLLQCAEQKGGPKTINEIEKNIDSLKIQYLKEYASEILKELKKII